MKAFYDYLCRIESFVAWSTLWTMVALIFAAGIARLCLYPINWAIDMSTCLFAWSCFLSADIAWRQDKLMNVDILIKKFPESVRRYLRLVNYTILFGFLAYLVIFGIWLSYTTRARTFQGIPGFSYTWVTLSVPVAAFLMFINTIIKFKRDFQSAEARDRMDIDHRP
ncbi:MAG: TRAP transporter small permease subunit [Deltaproteobacteria bacterium]|nr:TRAP transporter small permease subunit [Deltaproteobacteria bacterium]